MRALSAALAARGTAAERVAIEAFGAGGVVAPPGLDGDRPPSHPPSGPVGTGPPVTFARSNLTVPWDDGYGNLLELAEGCDVPVSFGCRNGVCHYCQSGLLTGEIAYNTAPLQPPDSEHVLVCCAQPTTGVMLEL